MTFRVGQRVRVNYPGHCLHGSIVTVLPENAGEFRPNVDLGPLIGVRAVVGRAEGDFAFPADKLQHVKPTQNYLADGLYAEVRA